MIGPGFSFEEEGAPDSVHAEVIRDASEVVWKDLTTLLITSTMLGEHEQSQLATTVPDDYRPHTNATLDVMRWDFMGHKVLQKLGAPLVIVGRTGDRDGHITNDDQVAVYAPKKFQTPTFDMIEARGDDQEPGFHASTALMPNSFPSVQDRTLNGTDFIVFSAETKKQLREEGLAERLFMTRTLLWATSYLDKPLPAFLNPYLLQAAVLYEKLAEDGIHPIGPEEAYGMMSSAYQNYLARHPEKDWRQGEE